MPSQFKSYGFLLCLLLRLGPVGASATRHEGQDGLDPLPGLLSREAIPAPFNWDSVKPTKYLRWHNCYTGHQCAKLLVPLDYSERNGRQAVIAMAKLPSSLPPNSSQYRGPVLINPGGPGGEGIDFLVEAGGSLAQIIGPEFDVISFDPRGLGRSTPRGEFFQDSGEREIWGGEVRTSALDATPDGVSRAWARAQIAGKLAQDRSGDFLQYINTENTARDMMEVVRAHGRDKLQYWGLSYGSVLGATFAAIFPNNVGRLVIDGILDPEVYYAARFSDSLVDSAKVQQYFYDGCYNAGPVRCPFWASSPEAIASNLTALYEKIRIDPVPVVTSRSYGLVDYNRLVSTVLRSIYSPYALFELLGKALADLANGDGAALYELFEQPTYHCPCNAPPNPASPAVAEGLFYVACTDGEQVPADLESAKQYYEEAAGQYEWTRILGNLRVGCSGWPRFERKNFKGPFVANTSHPILLVGNTADPVTPVSSAHKLSRGFSGSVVLTQDAHGHCSITAPSICTATHIRSYFFNGTLPEEGTLCPIDDFPWSNRTEAQSNSKRDGGELMEALQKLSRVYHPGFPF
ncbi:hypothetical protein AX16_007419 [Volvariella volvacea WC 439]|nr:hypothetical protein AX16_007419 [Volvariella volvacea WC 439]